MIKKHQVIDKYSNLNSDESDQEEYEKTLIEMKQSKHDSSSKNSNEDIV